MRIPIIPEKQTFRKTSGDAGLNFKAICIFASTGFFLDKDSYFNNVEALQPATEYAIDEKNQIMSSKPYWNWFYSPRDISLKQSTEEFAHLFEKICFEKLRDKRVILPLSGGLDSRTQAAVLNDNTDVRAYSYKFEDSFNETKYGRKISELKSFSFNEYTIPRGYLWKVIDELAELNQCYADFTHPRQMAVIEAISRLGDIFFLGHWGDVLFDSMDVDDNLSFEEQTNVLMKKIFKKGGLELASSLWAQWEIAGCFEEYLRERVSLLLQEIKIENANSRLRAFKSIYWAPRWTSANMVVFSNYHSLALPYYDDEMCKFICTIPEHILSGRKIQINYIKMKNPELAKIPWQVYDPLNLYNYEKYQSKRMIPNKAFKKGKRVIKEKILGQKMTTRNWEIQFLGDENDKHLKRHLFENERFHDFISPGIVKEFYEKFKTKDPVYYSHPLSILLTLSMFFRNNASQKND